MQRKLTAILSADVAGYSSLMERDEAGTLALLKENRAAVFDPLVAKHGGRQFKLMGDGALVEFTSVVAAVNCALAIQKETENGKAGPGDGKAIRYRIGINLGEVIVEGDDIYGEGVNVAARIQALAPVGGVALSKMVRDNVDGKMTCVFEDMGEHSVKNIERPVHVFRVGAEQDGQGQDWKVHAVRKNSICVLPFANMSGEPEQEYFSDGISEDIITDLSKVSALSVIARNTAFTFKGKHVDVAQVARQLKVAHVLEGSVRKSGNRVRITAQLIDGATNDHVWAERFDRDLNDIFALQDEISEAIVKALKLKLLPEEKKAIESRGTDSVEAYNLYLMARQHFVSSNPGDPRWVELVIRLCERAVEIDPNYAQAWALMAVAQNRRRYFFGDKGDGGLASANRALAIDARVAEAHAVKAAIIFADGRRSEAAAAISEALRLDPESHEVNATAGMLAYKQRQFEDAGRYFEKATTLLDIDSGSANMWIACCVATGNLQAARRAAQVCLVRAELVTTRDPANGAAMGHGVNALAVLGESGRAKEWMERALLVDPGNMNMRYNFACTLIAVLEEFDAGLALLEPVTKVMSRDRISHAKTDSDFDKVREHPRFKAMIAAAEARLATENDGERLVQSKA